MLFTVMESGDTEAIGPNCVPVFALGFAASMSDGMSLETCQAYGELFDQIAAHDARPKSTAAGGADSGRKRAKSAPASETSESAPLNGAASCPRGICTDRCPDDDCACDCLIHQRADGGFPGEPALPLDDVAE